MSSAGVELVPNYLFLMNISRTAGMSDRSFQCRANDSRAAMPARRTYRHTDGDESNGDRRNGQGDLVCQKWFSILLIVIARA